MFARNINGDTIQAFPIHKKTVNGVVTDLDVGELSILHCVEDTKITFTFAPGELTSIDALAGQDYGITQDVKTITSTAKILVS